HRSPWTRRFLSYGGTLLARIAFGSQMTDIASGFECFSRLAMHHVVGERVGSRANFFQTEIRHMMHGFRWKKKPVGYVNDQSRIGRRAIGESIRILAQMSLGK